MSDIAQIAKLAKDASEKMQSLSTEVKNTALKNISKELKSSFDEIIAANEKDLKNAEKLIEEGKISKAVYNRLKLSESKFDDILAGINDVIGLPDPINRTLLKRELAPGLVLEKISCPIGVLGIIFEARPDVIVQIGSLAVKSGNAVILKGGKEAVNTNRALFDAVTRALEKTEGFVENAINLIFSHDDVSEMLKQNDFIDLIIPRGSNKLVSFVKNNTKIPVLGHADGICHIYVDEKADFDKALKIIEDAKCNYPSACNAVETVLVNEKIRREFVPLLKKTAEKAGIKINSDEICRLEGFGTVENWHFEYGDKILSLKSVNSVEEAVNHVNTYGSGHTDCIVTEDFSAGEYFMNNVDSAGVYMNASTRFADGYRYGFGAEVGISTSKTHARGPVGLEGLTIWKYKLFGSGDTVTEFASGEKKFEFKDLT